MQNLKRFFSSRVFKWIFNDYTRIIIFAFISLRLYYFLLSEIALATANKTFHGHILEIIYTVPYAVFFVIIGAILAIILQKGLLFKSFLAGCLVTLLMISGFPLFSFHFDRLDIFEIHRYFPILGFPLSAAVIIITGLKKRISTFARDALAVVLGFAFIAGLALSVFAAYKFYSSTFYKNSIGFEIPVYPGSFDIHSKTERLTGSKRITFRKEAECSSYDIMNFYNEFWQKLGFSTETSLGDALWFQTDSLPVDSHLTGSLGTDSFLYRTYLNLESHVGADIFIHQIQIESKKTCTQNIDIKVVPYPPEYERIFSKNRKQVVDESLIEWLILANFQFYAQKPLNRYSPAAQEWFNKNFPNQNPSVLIKDFDGNGLSDVAVMACPAPGEKRADIFAIFSQEIVGCYRKIYSREAPDDTFILSVAKGTVLNFGEGTDTSMPKISIAHDAIALSGMEGKAIVYYWQPATKTMGSAPIAGDKILGLIKR